MCERERERCVCVRACGCGWVGDLAVKDLEGEGLDDRGRHGPLHLHPIERHLRERERERVY